MRILKFNKNLLVILDQGFFSLANFTINIWSGRILTQGDYGLFAIVFSIILFCVSLYSAIFTEPLLIFSKQLFEKQEKLYFSKIIRLLFIFLILTAVPFLYFFNIYVVAAILTFILLVFLRMLLLVTSDYYKLALGSFLYFLFSVTFIFFINTFFEKYTINYTTGYIALLGSATIVCVFYLFIVRKYFTLINLKNFNIKDKLIIKKHLSYSKWAIISNILLWVPANIYFFLFAFHDDAVGAGVFKAILNLSMPAVQINIALSNLHLVHFSKTYKDKQQFKTLIKKSATQLSIISLGYCFVLITFTDLISKVLYNGEYNFSLMNIIFLSFFIIISAFSQITRNILKVLNKLKIIFISYLFAALLSTIGGFYLIKSYSLLGGLIALTGSYSIILIWQSKFILKKDD